MRFKGAGFISFGLRHTRAQALTEPLTFIQQEETQSLLGAGTPGGHSQNVSATRANTGKSDGTGRNFLGSGRGTSFIRETDARVSFGSLLIERGTQLKGRNGFVSGARSGSWRAAGCHGGG